MKKLKSKVKNSLEKAVNYLLNTQHTTGSWTDFWLPVGTSDAWVTAYTGLGLYAYITSALYNEKTMKKTLTAVNRAGRFLSKQYRFPQGWGYNINVAPDADTTAHVLLFLYQLQLLPKNNINYLKEDEENVKYLSDKMKNEVVNFLKQHKSSESGYSTYNYSHQCHQWNQPCLDVTSSVLRSLFLIGDLDGNDLSQAWQKNFYHQQKENGSWQGYWWAADNYTTALTLEIWKLAGFPEMKYNPFSSLTDFSIFDLAWKLWINSIFWSSNNCFDCDRGILIKESYTFLTEILKAQAEDGAWPSAEILKVPPQFKKPGSTTLWTEDKRRIFTTATVIRVLSVIAKDLPHIVQTEDKEIAKEITMGIAQGVDKEISQDRNHSNLDQYFKSLIEKYAAALGFGFADKKLCVEAFNTLTKNSLIQPNPWPASQLSSLAGGIPLEFSAVLGKKEKRTLRYAVEVCGPYLPPYKRGLSGVEALNHTADYLGFSQGFSKILPVIKNNLECLKYVPDGLRFILWGGIAHSCCLSGDREVRLIFKIYLNLFHQELGSGTARLKRFLNIAEIPMSHELNLILKLLDESGFPQELGFGLTASEKIGCKIYYELPGWDRKVAEKISRLSGLSDQIKKLTPEIPGIIRESLAAKLSTGIALSINAEDGSIEEITTAAPFPFAMLSFRQTQNVLNNWINNSGWQGKTFRILSRILLKELEIEKNNAQAFPQQNHKLYSLFTRSVSRRKSRSAVYLRPFVG